MSRFLKFGFALAACALAGQAAAEPLGLGRAATPDEIAAWDIDIRPDGQGLPEGRGDVATGEEVFIEQCAVCHGDFAEGVDRWPVLAGGQDTLSAERPVKTIGSYWPYLSTVWDYVHRAMPFGNAQSLTDDEVYAITAYLLYSNDLVDDDFELSHENFAEVRLPNEDGFFADDRLESPVFAKADPCMTDCKPSVEITMRARVLDVTPDSDEQDSSQTDTSAEIQLAGVARGDKSTSAIEDTTPEPPDLQTPPLALIELDEDLVAAGVKVFRKCKACHQIGEGAKARSGPVLNGVYNAPAGQAEGYRYSKALTTASEGGLVWNDETLHGFLTNPKKYLKGTKMNFGGLKKDEERAAIIELLKSVSQ